MKQNLTFSLIFVVLGVVACGGDDGARRAQNGYEVVQEGSAAGVTSTIHGPGEVLPPITGTNADTTTAFTIDPNAVASTPPAQEQPPATLGGTLPPAAPPAASSYPEPMTSASPRSQANEPSRPAERPRSVSPSQPVRTQPSAPQPRPEPVEEPPATDTTATRPPQQQQPPQREAEGEKEQEEAEEPPPPPPTMTDTRGNQS